MTSTTLTRATWDGIADQAMTGVTPQGRTSEERILEILASTPPIRLAARARHRKPNRRRNTIVKAVSFSFLFAAALTVTAAHPQASTPANVILPPSVVTAAYTPVNWHARTCTAFYAWDTHRTTARLDALMTDSEHVAWKWLGEDVASLYRDVRGGSKTAKHVPDAATYVNQDCGG